jgi:hypothetical protein
MHSLVSGEDFEKMKSYALLVTVYLTYMCVMERETVFII